MVLLPGFGPRLLLTAPSGVGERKLWSPYPGFGPRLLLTAPSGVGERKLWSSYPGFGCTRPLGRLGPACQTTPLGVGTDKLWPTYPGFASASRPLGRMCPAI